MSVKLTQPIGEGIYLRESGTQRDVDYYVMTKNIPNEIGFGCSRLEGNCFYIIRHWYAGSRDLFDKLNSNLSWSELHFEAYGKLHRINRRFCTK